MFLNLLINFEEITPISILDIMISFGYLLFKWISLGILVTYTFIDKLANKLSLPANFALIMIVGASSNALINMFLLYMVAFSRTTIWILNLAISIPALLLTVKIFRRHYFQINRFEKTHIKSFLIIALSTFFIRLSILLGEFTYPGDDPKLYALIARRLLEEKSITSSWGIYAHDEWIVEKLHLFMIGFPSSIAEVTIATGIPLYKTVALVTQIMMWITILGVYILAEVATMDKWSGIYGAFIYGLLVTEPSLTWISWGGNAELAGLPYLVLLIALTIAYFQGILSACSMILLVSLLLASSIITHPFPIVYYVAGFIGITFSYTILHRNFQKIAETLLIAITSAAIAMLLSYPVLSHMIAEEIGVRNYYASSINPFWTPIFSYDQTASGAIRSFLTRVLKVYGGASLLAIPIGILIILRRRYLSIKEYAVPLTGMCFWWLILFFLHENNPNGLWLVKFPLWYRIDPNRTFCATSIPFTIIEAILLIGVISTFDRIKIKRISSLLTSKTAVVAYLLILIITVLILQQWVEPFIMFGKDDANVFHKISVLNMSGNIFVMPNDAGQWIPVVLGKPVILPMGVATRHDVLNMYYLRIYPTLCKDPCSPLVAEYFIKNNISYIYRGGKNGHLEIYPYRLTTSVVKSCKLVKPLFLSGKAVLYEYVRPKIVKISERYLEPQKIWGGGKYNVSYSEEYLLVMVDDSWVAFIMDLIPPRSPDLLYIHLKWYTERDVHFSVEALLSNGTLIRLIEPTSAKQFFKWGNGTTSWVDDYLRIPENVIQMRIIFGGKGIGKVDRKIEFVSIITKNERNH